MSPGLRATRPQILWFSKLIALPRRLETERDTENSECSQGVIYLTPRKPATAPFHLVGEKGRRGEGLAFSALPSPWLSQGIACLATSTETLSLATTQATMLRCMADETASRNFLKELYAQVLCSALGLSRVFKFRVCPRPAGGGHGQSLLICQQPLVNRLPLRCCLLLQIVLFGMCAVQNEHRWRDRRHFNLRSSFLTPTTTDPI